MTDRKITHMHKPHGRCNWRKCGECRHIQRDTICAKCAAYGEAPGEATDWSESYPACGLFIVEDISGYIPGVNLAPSPRSKPDKADGQLSFGELLK